ncbi:RNA polymerase, sigma-24 subunit, ECF subfamily [Kribbella flavida DSM 17836]|uniref:RNA polymerase, sigma-24 subunit, ECF subfamily n=1 Tax=Kribbella flavida (strain DSM 17836 / JCM 10339 / NBRC 14399) TaxID=479435 RepID=D2PW64_KRIFD|nr:SigE family RNA polymerase sigma factor [Kribbella flavida]ADB31516.1 RNA polymerase, sigma-24 subunit, ECF subfamily [Kribbella flavida DSM 17836]
MPQRVDQDEDFAAFVAARSARLMHIAHMLCGDRELARDIAQTALEKAYVRWGRIRLADPFAYVRQAVVNECRMGWRRRSGGEVPLATVGEADFGVRSVSSVADPAVAVTQRLDLLAALAGLTRRERTVVVLRYVENLSEAETARIVGIAPGTVKSTLARGRDKLRRSGALSSTITSGELA